MPHIIENLHDKWYKSKKDDTYFKTYKHTQDIYDRVDHILMMKYGIHNAPKNLLLLNIQPVLNAKMRPSVAARNVAEILENRSP
jgi:uncharacterized protein YcgL (UPF0745 family)